MIRQSLQIYCLVISCLIISCNTGDKQPQELDIDHDGLEVTVQYGAGDRYDVEGVPNAYLALPFNIAHHYAQNGDTLDVFILSERIYRGQDLAVTPIGTLRVMDEGTPREYHLSIPVNTNRQTFDAQKFADFAVEYAHVKWMIEQYIVNHKGMSRVRMQSWEDEQYALRRIKEAQKLSLKG